MKTKKRVLQGRKVLLNVECMFEVEKCRILHPKEKIDNNESVKLSEQRTYSGR